MIVCLWPFELAFKVVPDRAVWVRSGGYPAYPIPPTPPDSQEPPVPSGGFSRFVRQQGLTPLPPATKGTLAPESGEIAFKKGPTKGLAAGGEIGNSKREQPDDDLREFVFKKNQYGPRVLQPRPTGDAWRDDLAIVQSCGVQRRLRNGTNRYASAQGWQRHQLQEGRPARSRPTARPEQAYPDIERRAVARGPNCGWRGPDGLHNYLAKQAKANPSAFMAMLSKVIPLQPTGGDNGKIIVDRVLTVVRAFECRQQLPAFRPEPRDVSVTDVANTSWACA